MTTHRNKHSFDKNRFFCIWIANMLIILILAGCDALNVVQNAGDLKDEDLYALNALIIDGEIIDPAGGPVWTQQDFEARIEDSVNVGVDILDTFEVKAVAPIPTTN